METVELGRSMSISWSCENDFQPYNVLHTSVKILKNSSNITIIETSQIRMTQKGVKKIFKTIIENLIHTISLVKKQNGFGFEYLNVSIDKPTAVQDRSKTQMPKKVLGNSLFKNTTTKRLNMVLLGDLTWCHQKK